MGVYLLELEVYNLETDSLEQLYLATDPWVSRPTDTPANQPYAARLERPPKISRSLYSPGTIGGRSVASAGEAWISNLDGEMDFLERCAVDSRSVRLLYHPTGKAARDEFSTVFVSTMDDVLPGHDRIVLMIRSPQFRLDESPAAPDFFLPHHTAAVFGTEAKTAQAPSVASPYNLANYTVEFRFRMQPGAAWGALVSFGRDDTNPNGQASVRIGNSSWGGGAQININGTSATYSGRSYLDGMAHHAALRRRGDDYELLIDGEMVCEATVSTTTVTNNYYTIGARKTATGLREHPEAEIWEVRTWDHGRTDEQLLSLREARLEGTEEGLRSYWRLDEGVDVTTGLVATDSNWYDPSNNSNGIFFDSGPNKHHGIFVTDGEWSSTGEGPGGVRKPLPVGHVFNLEPSLLDARAQRYAVSDGPVRHVEVTEGGRVLIDQPRIDFDGTATKVTISGSSDYAFTVSDEFTVETLFQIDDPDWAAGDIVNLLDQPGTGSANGWYLRAIKASTGKFRVFGVATTGDGSGGLTVWSNTLLSSGRRYRISFAVNAAEDRGALYLNGRLENTAEPVDPAWTGGFGLSTTDILVGVEAGGSPDYFPGKIWDLRLWETEREPDEIESWAFRPIRSAPASLVGYWRMNEGTGTTAGDLAAGANDGTITSGTWVDAQVAIDRVRGLFDLSFAPTAPIRANVEGWMPFGPSVALDGSTGRVKLVAAEIPAGSFTVAGWFRSDRSAGDAGSNQTMIYRWDANAGAFQLRLSDQSGPLENSLELALQTSTGSHTVSTSALEFEVGRWHHAAAVFDETAGEARLYLDGRLGHSESVTGTRPAHTRLINIGSGSSSNHVLGAVSDVLIATRAMDADEIAALPYTRPAPDDSALYRWLPMNEDTGTTTHDLSTNLDSGTLDGGAVWDDGVFPETPGEAIRWLVASRAALLATEVDLESLRDYDALLSSPRIGWLAEDSSVSAVLDDLLRPAGFFGFGPNGELELGRLTAPDVYRELRLHSGGYAGASAYAEVQYGQFTAGSQSRRITAELWAERLGEGSTTEETLFEVTANYAIYFDNADGQLHVKEWNGDFPGDLVDWTDSGWKLDPGNRRHIALVLGGSEPILYLDGSPASSGTSSTTAESGSHVAQSIEVGRGGNVRVSEVRVWSRARTPSEIASSRFARLDGETDHLVGYWRMDQAEGTTVPNLASSRHVTAGEDLLLFGSSSWDLVARHSEPLTPDSTEIVPGIHSRVVPMPAEVPRQGVVVKYRKNWSPMSRDDLLGLVTESPADVERYTRASSLARRDVANDVTERHPSAPGALTLETALVDAADAQAAANLEAANFGVRRRPWNLLLHEGASLGLRAGDEILVKSRRETFGVMGKGLVVLDDRLDPSRDVLELVAWG